MPARALLDDATNFQRNYSTGEVEIADGVIYHKTEYRERRDHFAYFACSEPLAGFDTQREAFLGSYRGWDRPLAVERSQTINKTLVRPVIDFWLRPAVVVEGFTRLRDAWASLLSVTRVETPDGDTNRMVTSGTPTGAWWRSR